MKEHKKKNLSFRTIMKKQENFDLLENFKSQISM